MVVSDACGKSGSVDAFCLYLVAGRLLAWLCSVPMLDIEQVPRFIHPSRGHNSMLFGSPPASVRDHSSGWASTNRT